MILDKINNWGVYFKKTEFIEVFNELKKITLETPNGIYKNHEFFYIKVMSYDSVLESTIIESHRKEVDVQILLSGKEKIKIYDIESVEIIEEYNKETDCQFYKTNGNPISEISLMPGYMAVFFPEDIHHPMFAVESKIEKLKKIVIKIDEKLFA